MRWGSYYWKGNLYYVMEMNLGYVNFIFFWVKIIKNWIIWIGVDGIDYCSLFEFKFKCVFKKIFLENIWLDNLKLMGSLYLKLLFILKLKKISWIYFKYIWFLKRNYISEFYV